nr:hypothetical protein CFP56_43314 [Quercus suber]
MLDKRRLGNSGETFHIIERVLVVVAFQISPDATNTLPVDGWGLLRIKLTACGQIWAHKTLFKILVLVVDVNI